MSRQDSAFYTNSAGTEVVWESREFPRFYVVRNGEMRIHAKRGAAEFDPTVIRYTDQLEEFGIKTDEQLNEWTDKGDEYFLWVNNSWFEVYDEKDKDWFSEPIDNLTEAVEFAESLQKKYADVVPLPDILDV